MRAGNTDDAIKRRWSRKDAERFKCNFSRKKVQPEKGKI